MFTQPVSSPPPGPQTSSAASPSRPSRLRGLTYLRNYTQNHLLSRDTQHSSSGNTTPSPRQTGGLTRSVSYTPASSAHGTQGQQSSNGGHRLSLVNSTPEARLARSANPLSPGDAIPESPDQQRQSSAPEPATEPAEGQSSAMTSADAAAAEGSPSPGPSDSQPSLRLSAYYDPRSTRPSLTFSPITRTLPNGSEVIRVGRYSERDNQPMASVMGNQPSAAPVGFKSKVVSRRHCEFWCEDGKWFVKDVKSSSGTFLNHIRLSPPSQESKAFPVNDGDIVQLGIDFKGGEEMIFRCVKMRLELNRGWQNKPNTFNMAAHKRLRTMASKTSAVSNSSQDCSICLNSIAPCQSLFVAPCSHTWHFKCIKSLLTSPQYPVFICPNCRAGADLEADVEEPTAEWEMLQEDEEEDETQKQPEAAASADSPAAGPSANDSDAMDVTINVSANDTPSPRSQLPHTISSPLPIRNPASGAARRGTPSPPRAGAEGPITPRNDAGPWVFDGNAGRQIDTIPEMTSLDAAATEMDLTVQLPSDDSSR